MSSLKLLGKKIRASLKSIAIVFETLQSLYKENRIVGIISHVAELQERIPRSINVIKDEEKGSFVTESWN